MGDSTLETLATPALVLDRPTLERNLTTMATAVGRHGVRLRPHLKTAKSVEVARRAIAGQAGGIAVSTLAEADYFAQAGFTDQLYAVGITPQKLARAAALIRRGVNLVLTTDDVGAARAIAALATAEGLAIRTVVEVDCGEHRAGVAPDSEQLLAVAAALGPCCIGVMTHGGHSYGCQTPAEAAVVAESERVAAVTAAERLRSAGVAVSMISVGSTPTARFANRLDGVTEARPGVYMFQDLFQIQLAGDPLDSIAVTVLASVTSVRPAEGVVLVDAGGIALSKDRSTASAPTDYGYGLLLDLDGQPSFGRALVERANQEHGVIRLPNPADCARLPVGSLVRIATNHICMTAAAFDRYHVVDGTRTITAVWPRVNGW
ncbi:MAG: DSD1 family PLP-dependent enzyme [Alphaproteobacteria bacterium]|nr:alanine racemase [Alphaproteobacteria bacterium]TAD88142.1 MAG: DSD1 family PLP-dependent enzyme [Alphaproteobacteria bacterium]